MATIEQLQNQIEDIHQRRATIEAELAELRAEQQGDMGADVEKAVAKHTKLAAEIAGRESVLRTLTNQLEPLTAALTTAKEEERKQELKTLEAEIAEHTADVEEQTLAILEMARSTDIQAKIRRYEVLHGPFSSVDYRLNKLIGSLAAVEELRNNERLQAKFVAQRAEQAAAEAARKEQRRRSVEIAGIRVPGLNL